MLINHVGSRAHIMKKNYKKAEPQEEKISVNIGYPTEKSWETVSSCHLRKQADLNTYHYNGQNKGTTPCLPGW